MGLDKFPETFNLQGFFPLAFSRVENFSYRGVYPSADQYSPDDMPEEKREKFLAWHTEKIRENAVCDFHEEVVRYCESDVQLLKEGCLKFIEEFEEIAGFNLLIESVTIASACNLFCRREKLEEDLIAIKPQNGWRGNRVNQSKVVLEWLYFEDWKLGGVSRVRHVRNGGEVKVLTLAKEYFVDRFDERTNTVYEFFGCYYHGCKNCFKTNCFKTNRSVRRNCHLDRTIQEMYEATLRKSKMLRWAGYTIVGKWECEFENDKKTDPQIQEFLKTLEFNPVSA